MILRRIQRINIQQGFDVKKDLQRIGVVNQTTMLASDTQAIADYLETGNDLKNFSPSTY